MKEERIGLSKVIIVSSINKTTGVTHACNGVLCRKKNNLDHFKGVVC